MVSAGTLCAKRDQLLVRIAFLGMQIGGRRYGEQEIGIGSDAQVIAVLRQQLVAQRIRAGGNALTPEIDERLRELDEAHELAVGQFGIERTGKVLLRGREVFREPELRCPAVVQRHAMALLLDSLPE